MAVREVIKERSITALIATLVACIPLLTAIWFVVKPSIVLAVGDALNEQVQRTVAKEVAPINTALAIIIRNNIDSLKRRIAALEYRRDFPPQNDWKDSDAQDLTNLELELKSAEAALSALT